MARAGDHPDAPGPVPLRQPRRPAPRRQAQRLLRQMRLVRAAIKRFADYCRPGDRPPAQNFSIRYDSNIPRQVGWPGRARLSPRRSAPSARFTKWPSLEVLPGLILSVETEEIDRRRFAGSRRPGLRGAGLHGFRPRAHARRTGTVATSRSTRGSCRRSTSPTSRTWPSSPTSSTTTFGSGTRAASGR